jgi:hypothetical protein
MEISLKRPKRCSASTTSATYYEARGLMSKHERVRRRLKDEPDLVSQPVDGAVQTKSEGA